MGTSEGRNVSVCLLALGSLVLALGMRESVASVDDLLDEIDGLLSSPKTTRSTAAQAPPGQPTAEDEDIDKLLAAVGGDARWVVL